MYHPYRKIPFRLVSSFQPVDVRLFALCLDRRFRERDLTNRVAKIGGAYGFHHPRFHGNSPEILFPVLVWYNLNSIFEIKFLLISNIRECVEEFLRSCPQVL